MVGEKKEVGEYTYTTDVFLVTLPSKENNELVYDVVAQVKYKKESTKPTPTPTPSPTSTVTPPTNPPKGGGSFLENLLPNTGDESDIWKYVVLFCVSCAVFLYLVFWRNQKGA